MIEYKLNIGDVATSSGKVNYTCFGLGSCIGLFLQDRVTGFSGGAHILLPDWELSSFTDAKFYNVTSALNEILSQFKTNGISTTALRAKVTGGANVISLNGKTGERNVQSIIKHLTQHKIYIAALDVGGNLSRTARFESETGKLTVKTQLNEYKIL